MVTMTFETYDDQVDLEQLSGVPSCITILHELPQDIVVVNRGRFGFEDSANSHLGCDIRLVDEEMKVLF